MNKKILGYKLTKPEYEDAALKICGINNFIVLRKGLNFTKGSINYSKLKEAGVLDLWFEPVYENIAQSYNMGEFRLKIIDGVIFHKSENITGFVEELVSTCGIEYRLGKKDYKAKVKEVIFSSTGCEDSETKLSDWKKVLEIAKSK